MKNITLAALLAASFVSVSAHATDATINVTATVDPILSISAPGGAALQKDLTLAYDATTGKLNSATLPFALISNQQGGTFDFKIASDVKLLNGAKEIPLTVKIDDKELSTTATSFNAADVYNGFTMGAKGAESKELKLNVATTEDKPVMAGTYSGNIVLEVTQQP